MELLIVAVLVLLFLALVVAMILGARGNDSRDDIVRRLSSIAKDDAERLDIVRIVTYSSLPWLDDLLAESAFMKRMETLRQQSQVSMPLGALLLISVLLCFAGILLGQFFSLGFMKELVLGCLIGYLPVFWMKKRRQKRLEKFQRQLPDALDLVARALQSGHAFAGGIRMVADEFADPLGPEFAAMLDEINFGISPDKALANLASRINSPDLQFFVVSVNIQRETGGNLAEIISTISGLIRERFQLRGKVRTLSAEGRLSALILIALPFIVAFVIYLMNPDYMGLMFTHPLGRMMTGSSLFSMLVGSMFIRRMVNIKV